MSQFISFISTIARGIAIGVADLVPGVSGSTVALLLGIYPHIIRNLAAASDCLTAMLRGNWQQARYILSMLEWSFLFALACGVFSALLLFAPLLLWLLNEYPSYLFAFFFGMTLAVVITLGRALTQQNTHTRPQKKIAFAVLFATGLSIGVLLSLASWTHTEPSLALLCLAAACAICAMLLPGVSGSFILLLFGAYQPIIHAVANYSFDILVPVIISMLCAALCFLRLLRWMLLHYYHYLLTLFAGLLFGGLTALWPWSHANVASYPHHSALLLCIISGCVCVLVVDYFSKNTCEYA